MASTVGGLKHGVAKNVTIVPVFSARTLPPLPSLPPYLLLLLTLPLLPHRSASASFALLEDMAVACLLISPQISSETPSCSVPHPYRPRAATPLCGLAAIGALAIPNGRPPSLLQVGVDRLRSAP